MTQRAGSSDVFWGGVVTYANEAKAAILGVDPKLIEAHGAVSGPVAQAMVLGWMLRTPIELAVSITGVAGPTGGTVEKPVGTVWFGVGRRREGRIEGLAVRLDLTGSRGMIQRDAAAWSRALARRWWGWESELDSFLGLTDNEGKPAVAASHPFFSFPSNP